MRRSNDQVRLRLTRRAAARFAATVLIGLGPWQSIAAQTVAPAAGGQGYVSRNELEAFAARVETANAQGATAQQRAEVMALRERLREGDFKVGDKVVITTSTAVSLPDPLREALNSTHTLREGKVLRLLNLGDLSLQGVLRAELDSVVNAHVARYLRNVTVRAEPLVQVLVSGPVQRPGFHPVAPDLSITDMLMGTAGPTAAADLRKTVVKRNGEEIISADSLNAAILAGATLDRIDFQSGDQFAVATRDERSKWQRFIQVIGVVSSLAGIILLVDRLQR